MTWTQELTQAYDASFAYQGDDHGIEIPIGESVQMPINLTGEAVFGPEGDPDTNLFQILIGLRDALQGNDIPGVQSSLERLNNFQSRINSHLADVGSRLSRLENCKNLLSNLKENHTQRLSDIEDMDIVKAMTDLSARENAYQAALYSAAQITGLSLVDFLR